MKWNPQVRRQIPRALTALAILPILVFNSGCEFPISEERTRDPGREGCPASACMPYLEMKVLTREPLPLKIRVTLNGEITLDECKDPKTWTLYPGHRNSDPNLLYFMAPESTMLDVSIYGLDANCNPETEAEEIGRLDGVPVEKPAPEFFPGTQCPIGCQGLRATVALDPPLD